MNKSSKNPWAIYGGNSASFDGKSLILSQKNKKAPALFELVHTQFRAMVLSKPFSCIAAKAAFKQNTYRFGLYKNLNSLETTQKLSHDLFRFTQEQNQMDTGFTTFVACFQNPIPKGEKHFEKLLWEQLQKLHHEDAKYHEWDKNVSDDVFSPKFSFSFAEVSFFIVGMHPKSSRIARRFIYPTLVFNAHHQFEDLRKNDKYQVYQKIIRKNEINLQGFINPNLTSYGEDTEAKQYSGRVVRENEWKCPFFNTNK